jgi:hypothetical protein
MSTSYQDEHRRDVFSFFMSATALSLLLSDVTHWQLECVLLAHLHDQSDGVLEDTLKKWKHCSVNELLIYTNDVGL